MKWWRKHIVFSISKNHFDGQLDRFTLLFDKERLSFSRSSSIKDESESQSVAIQQWTDKLSVRVL